MIVRGTFISGLVLKCSTSILVFHGCYLFGNSFTMNNEAWNFDYIESDWNKVNAITENICNIQQYNINQ